MKNILQMSPPSQTHFHNRTTHEVVVAGLIIDTGMVQSASVESRTGMVWGWVIALIAQWIKWICDVLYDAEALYMTTNLVLMDSADEADIMAIEKGNATNVSGTPSGVDVSITEETVA